VLRRIFESENGEGKRRRLHNEEIHNSFLEWSSQGWWEWRETWHACGDEKWIQNLSRINLDERDHLGDVGILARTKLRRILQK